MQYRADETTNNADYIIQKQKGIIFKKWKTLITQDNVTSKENKFDKYEKAEEHIYREYTNGHGIGSKINQIGNVYEVTYYTMYQC